MSSEFCMIEMAVNVNGNTITQIVNFKKCVGNAYLKGLY
jgi:hypothetical protein